VKRSLLTAFLFLLAGLGTLAADRVAMFTEVVGPVRVGTTPARTLLAVLSGAEIQLPSGTRATLTFFSDGHRERLQGPCRVRVGVSAATVLEGVAGCRVRSEGAPASVLAPTGQNLRRMGGGLQALAEPSSAERAEVQALAVLFSVGDVMESGPPGPTPRVAPPPMEPAPAPMAAPPVAAPPPPAPSAEPAAPAAPPPPPPPPPPAATRPSLPKISPPLAPGAPVQALPVTLPRLTAQRLFALPPRLSWTAVGPVRLSLSREGQEIWSARCEGNSLQLPGAIPPGRYLWVLQPEESTRPSQAEIQVLPGSERVMVRRAFREATQMQDFSGWVLLMANLADQGLLNEALLANREALRLQPEDATLHLAAARLLWQMGLEDQAREHALRGTLLDSTQE